jgi:pimeloyl-ACP methyl ester carboxylesterase
MMETADVPARDLEVGNVGRLFRRQLVVRRRTPVLVDLVQISTRDGLRLDGMFQEPAGPPAQVGIDSVCLVHGTGSNFYGSTLFDGIAERLRALGVAVLRINTRGHDGISTAALATGGRRLGAAFEVVDDCRHDLAGWTDWLRQRAGPRIGLIGHSLGAVKCLYALAQEPKTAAWVVALSPPRLSYSWFCSSPEGPAFLETYARAEQAVRDGQPAALLEVKLPLPFAIAAAGYLEKYGPDERYNYLRFLPGVPCPTLITLGSKEVESNMAFRGAPDEIRVLGSRNPRLRLEVIADGDHFYTGVRPELISRLEAWLWAAFPA